jgi:hypothetical protein
MTEATPEEVMETCLKAIKPYWGTISKLESAIGAYVLGLKFGWRVLFLIHTKSTIRTYEKILGISFREKLPEVGELAHKSVAWEAMQKFGNFWKAVKGEIAGVRSQELRKTKDKGGR